MISGLRQSLQRDGFTWRSQIVVFFLAALAIVSRRPDVLFNPQFWAEEGSIFFAQAYNLGWAHVFAVPNAGYLHTFPRAVAAVSLLVPIRFAPLVMNVTGLVLQVLPVSVLLGARSTALGALPIRLVYSVLYLCLPNSWEVNVNLTCSQFHLTLAALLIILSKPPLTAAGKSFDIAVILSTGMTGPFAILLLPIGVMFWWLRRYLWTLVNATILAICASIQAFTLVTAHGTGARVYQGPLGATPLRFCRIVAGQVFAGALLGQNSIGLSARPILIVIVAAVGLSFLLYVLIRSRPEMKLLIFFCLLLFAASLSRPYIEGSQPQWVMLLAVPGCRYWLFPMLATVWSLVWCVAESPIRWIRMLSLVALCVMGVGIVRDWSYSPYANKHFAQFARQFATAPPHKAFTIPINPDGWFVRLVKK